MNLSAFEKMVNDWYAHQPKNDTPIVVRIELRNGIAKVVATQNVLTMKELVMKTLAAARDAGTPNTQLARVWNAIQNYSPEHASGNWNGMLVLDFLEDHSNQELSLIPNVGRTCLTALNEMLVQNGFGRLRNF